MPIWSDDIPNPNGFVFRTHMMEHSPNPNGYEFQTQWFCVEQIHMIGALLNDFVVLQMFQTEWYCISEAPEIGARFKSTRIWNISKMQIPFLVFIKPTWLEHIPPIIWFAPATPRLLACSARLQAATTSGERSAPTHTSGFPSPLATLSFNYIEIWFIYFECNLIVIIITIKHIMYIDVLQLTIVLITM